MGEPKFVDELNAFEKDDINAKTMKLIRDKYINNKEIDPDESKISMGAGDAVAKCLHKWLLAIESYDKIAKSVAPKKEVMLQKHAIILIFMRKIFLPSGLKLSMK